MAGHEAATALGGDPAARPGRSVPGDHAASAAQALDLATVDPDRALRLSVQAEEGGLADGDWATVSAARRAAGVAAMHRRHLDEALVRLRAAMAAADRAADRRLRGEARMSLASVQMLRGAPRLAFASIDAALGELTGLAAARARTQRSAILQELGRVDQALDDLRIALPVLRRSGDVQWEVRALSNRSLMLSARRQFPSAQADLLRAKSLCDEHGLTLAGAYVEQNLGCVFAGRGQVPAALEHFDAAAARYRSLGLQVGSLLVDRANLLLFVRLVGEAREAAEAAVSVHTAQRRRVQLPEAHLIVSTAALLQDDVDTARRAARAAARACVRLGRKEWLALARYAELQADVAAAGLGGPDGLVAAEPTAPGVSPRRARARAVELERSGWTVPALEARVLAGRLALLRGQLSSARADLTMAARARRAGPADARARAWLAEALLREAEGRRRAALSALRTGLRIVEDYRATLGATELRAHISVHRGALARAGLRMALADGDARAAHWWAERGRASATLLRPARPPQDPALAHDLEALRGTVAEIDRARGAGLPTRALVAAQVDLEQRIRDHTRRLRAEAVHRTAGTTLRELSADLGGNALVEYVHLDAELHVITVVDGRPGLHPLGSAAPLRDSLIHLPFALHRLARSTTPQVQLRAAAQVLGRIADTLHATLLAPLLPLVGDRPLVVVATGWLQSVPWSVLPSCRGRPVSVVPSAALWHQARRRRPAGGGVVVVAGPGLAGARDEAAAVAALHPDAQLLAGPAATSASVAAAMNGARLAHVATHGLVRADNPLFSSLLLADGPFTVYDLERLDSSPHHVVLAACDTARSHVTAGEEILGLAAALFQQRTATLVAPIVAIPDAETAPLMVGYHRLVRDGCPPATALAQAQDEHRRDGARSMATAASFVCLGAGT